MSIQFCWFKVSHPELRTGVHGMNVPGGVLLRHPPGAKRPSLERIAGARVHRDGRLEHPDEAEPTEKLAAAQTIPDESTSLSGTTPDFSNAEPEDCRQPAGLWEECSETW